jgi:hypothetical protein
MLKSLVAVSWLAKSRPVCLLVNALNAGSAAPGLFCSWEQPAAIKNNKKKEKPIDIFGWFIILV